MSGLAVHAQQNPDNGHKPMRTDMEVTPRFGLRAGVNLATIEIDDDSQSNPINTNNKTSFHAGAFVNIPIGGIFRIQPEVNYSGQGSKVSASILGTEVRDEWDFHYINVPVMLQLQSRGGLFVETGPQVGFLLSAKDEDDTDLKEDMKKTDFGWGAGIGYLSRIGLGINGRYNFGFSNIYDEDAAGDEGKYKNRTIQLGLVYHFGAHK